MSHVHGTDLVVEHIEKFWCPTIASTDFTGKPAFRFAEADKPHAVLLISEPEYKTNETLPEFAHKELESRGIRCTVVMGDETDGSDLPGLEILNTADLLVMSVRRRSPRVEQLAQIRAYLQAGKPLVAIRTSSHAFHTRGQHPEGRPPNGKSLIRKCWGGITPDIMVTVPRLSLAQQQALPTMRFWKVSMLRRWWETVRCTRLVP